MGKGRRRKKMLLPSLRSQEERNQLVIKHAKLCGFAVKLLIRQGVENVLRDPGEACAEAILPLIRASELWDEAKGTFASYALACIKRYLLRTEVLQPVVPLPTRFRYKQSSAVDEKGRRLGQCYPLNVGVTGYGDYSGDESKDRSPSMAFREEDLYKGREKWDQLLWDEFHAAVNRLPPILRIVYDCRFIEGENNLQTSEKLGLKITTVRGRVNEIYHRLRVFMKQIPDVPRDRRSHHYKRFSAPSV